MTVPDSFLSSSDDGVPRHYDIPPTTSYSEEPGFARTVIDTSIQRALDEMSMFSATLEAIHVRIARASNAIDNADDVTLQAMECIARLASLSTAVHESMRNTLY